MTRSEIERYLRLVGHKLQGEGTTGEILLAGGAVMLLLLRSREMTRDVDAYLSGDVSAIRRAVRQVAEEQGLPADWLNDGVKGFFYGTPPQIRWAEYPGLRVYAVDPRYLFAMKAVAGRASDIDDLKALVAHLHLRSAAEGMKHVERYIPSHLQTPRVRYIVESLFETARRPTASTRAAVRGLREWPYGYVTSSTGKTHLVSASRAETLCGWRFPHGPHTNHTPGTLPKRVVWCATCKTLRVPESLC